MDQIVTLETAKLAMEVGYDGKFLYQYIEGDDFPSANLMFNDEHCIDVDDLDLDADQPECCDIPAPTQTALSKWLREKEMIYVCIGHNGCGWWWNIEDIDGDPICQSIFTGPNKYGNWDSYEEALEGGLKQACKIVKNREGK